MHHVWAGRTGRYIASGLRQTGELGLDKGTVARHGGGVGNTVRRAGEAGREAVGCECGQQQAGILGHVRMVRGTAVEAAGVPDLQGLDAARLQNCAGEPCPSAYKDWRLRDIERLAIQQWVIEKFARKTRWQTVRNS